MKRKSSLIAKCINEKKHNNKVWLVFLTLLTIINTTVCSGMLFLFLEKDANTVTASEIFKSNVNSIVEVKAYSESVGESFGTAEFINNEGMLVTNAHVVTYTSLQIVNEFEHYYIRFATDDDYIEVELIRYNSELDIAILQMDTNLHTFKAMKIGDSAKIETGDKIYAIGNSANYGLSMSEGIVGMPSLNITHNNVTRNVIQCSVNITEGNSGGALLDDKGRLLGITTFRTKDMSGNVIYGISYCIPINTVLGYINNN